MNRRFRAKTVGVLLGLVLAFPAQAQQPSSDLIPNPLHPSSEEPIFCNACSILDPELIPIHLRQKYIPDHPMCGTGALQEAVKNWDRLSADSRAKLTTLFQRPTTQRTHSSPSGRFLIHYDVSGFHAVDTADSDGNGIPDYVDFTATTFDDVWIREIEGLGYLEPPDDGDGVYDVHIQQLGLQGVYGLAFAAGGTTASSYIQIDNNFTDDIFLTRGFDGVQVTAAHEFFHAIQFAYYASFDAGWWQELTATWMEDVMYDDVNDYYQYQPFFFQEPEVSLDEYSFAGLQPFAASVFGHHLQQVYGTETIRATWESLGTRTPTVYDISDIDVALPGGFASVLPRFVVWNYLTGSRHIPGYYEEGADYFGVSPRTVTPVSGISVGGSARIDHMASTYLSVETANLSGGLQVSFSLESGSTYEVNMLLIKDGSPEVVALSGLDVTIANVSQYDQVVFVPVSTSTSGSNFDIGYSVLNSSTVTTTSDLVGDFDADGAVAFSDFLAFVSSFGKSATEHDRFHDLNADGSVGFTDFLIFASHFGESP
jgi:hypothetical protein